jgi:hypothetical protein
MPSFISYQRPKIFRSAIKYKRYYIGPTVFTRKHLRKLRHKATWALYYNVFKYWTDAIRIARQYARFQYHYKFFVNNAFAAYGNTFASKRNRLYIRQYHWVGATLTRCFFLTAGRKQNADVSKSHKGGHHAAIFFPTDTIVADLNVTPTLALFDQQCFAKNTVIDYDQYTEVIDFSILQTLILSKHVELYKILVLCWYYHVLNLIIFVWELLYV